MTWGDTFKVALAVLAALGGARAIVFGLSQFLGDAWLMRRKGDIDAQLQRMKGDIDERLRRVDARLEHQNFVKQKLSELELTALVECWRKARGCLPLMNAIRPHDSGTDYEEFKANAHHLSTAHNELIETTALHEPFLPERVVRLLDDIGKLIRLELSQTRTRQPYVGDWWEQGEKNRDGLERLVGELLVQVRTRSAELRAEESGRE